MSDTQPPRESADVLSRLAATIASRLEADAGTSYVASLAKKGHDAILKKVAEEAAETLLASKDGDKLHLIRETADLWFHCMVLLAWHGAGPADVLNELERREGTSGIVEKNARR
jgi:phosphoribosyl-ATP pyrophosphohydrolase